MEWNRAATISETRPLQHWTAGQWVKSRSHHQRNTPATTLNSWPVDLSVRSSAMQCQSRYQRSTQTCPQARSGIYLKELWSQQRKPPSVIPYLDIRTPTARTWQTCQKHSASFDFKSTTLEIPPVNRNLNSSATGFCTPSAVGRVTIIINI